LLGCRGSCRQYRRWSRSCCRREERKRLRRF
jgi:hypothetical protein